MMASMTEDDDADDEYYEDAEDVGEGEEEEEYEDEEHDKVGELPKDSTQTLSADEQKEKELLLMQDHSAEIITGVRHLSVGKEST
jgi:hypothetical protein